MKLRELLAAALSDPGEIRPILGRYGLDPPTGLATDEERAEWTVDQIAAQDIWTDVVKFRNESSSGCSCDLGARRYGAGGWHYFESDSAYWVDRQIKDMMTDRSIGTAYRDRFIEGLGEGEIGSIESYADQMSGTRVAYEPCPRYRSTIGDRP